MRITLRQHSIKFKILMSDLAQINTQRWERSKLCDLLLPGMVCATCECSSSSVTSVVQGLGDLL